jgi:hypothetical protein
VSSTQVVCSEERLPEFTTILRSQKVHYNANKSQPVTLTLRQVAPEHITLAHSMNIHFNIILASTTRFHQWPLSSFDTKLLHAFLFWTTRAKCPAHLILLDLIITIIYREQCSSDGPPYCPFYSVSCYSSPLRSEQISEHTSSEIPLVYILRPWGMGTK